MEKDESDGYFRATVDLADGIFHYQFKSTNKSLIQSLDIFLSLVQTKSWFEQEPEPAVPNYEDDEYKELSMNAHSFALMMKSLLFSSRRKTTESRCSYKINRRNSRTKSST